VTPERFGVSPAESDAVRGGTPDENAATTRAIFAGEPGAARDVAVLNAGAAIYAAGRSDTLETASSLRARRSTRARPSPRSSATSRRA